MELKALQREVDDFIKTNHLETSIETRVLDLTSEVGELAKEVLKGTQYGKEPLKLTEEWETELGDVLFSLITIANSSNINLEKALQMVLDKYRARMTSKGDIGSGK